MVTALGATMEISCPHRLQLHVAQSAIYYAVVVLGDYTHRRHGVSKTDVTTADMFLMVKQLSESQLFQNGNTAWFREQKYLVQNVKIDVFNAKLFTEYTDH